MLSGSVLPRLRGLPANRTLVAPSQARPALVVGVFAFTPVGVFLLAWLAASACRAVVLCCLAAPLALHVRSPMLSVAYE